MIVSFNEPTTTIYTRWTTQWVLRWHPLGLVSQLIRLPGTFQATITMGIVNPVVDETTIPTIECTLVFGNGQTD